MLKRKKLLFFAMILMKNDIFTVYYFTSLHSSTFLLLLHVYSQVILQTNTYFSGMCYEIRNRKNKHFSKGSLIDFFKSVVPVYHFSNTFFRQWRSARFVCFQRSGFHVELFWKVRFDLKEGIFWIRQEVIHIHTYVPISWLQQYGLGQMNWLWD